MRRISPLICALVFSTVNTSAKADPINAVASNVIGLYGVSPILSVPLPDPSRGGSAWLGGASLDVGYGYTMWQSFHQSTDSDFTINMVWVPPGTASPSNPSSHFSFSGHVTGSIDGKDGESHLQGGYQGTAQTSQIWIAPSEVTIPRPLLDLIDHPERVHINAWVTDGYFNNLDVKLTIDPPLPVPEPTALTMLLVVAGGVTALGRRGKVW